MFHPLSRLVCKGADPRKIGAGAVWLDWGKIGTGRRYVLAGCELIALESLGMICCLRMARKICGDKRPLMQLSCGRFFMWFWKKFLGGFQNFEYVYICACENLGVADDGGVHLLGLLWSCPYQY